MAKSENNEVMFGARGRVGNLVVFKNYYGRTLIAKLQKKRENPVYSIDQEFAKERFKEGVIYAKGVIKDPVLSSFYKPFAKDGRSIYNVALADFCKPPQIKSIKTSTYQGKIGDYLTIRAIDNFRIVGLVVTIKKLDGTVIESGTAVLTPNSLDWIYLSTVLNTCLDKTIISIKASDTPGNVTELEQPLIS